MNWIRVEDKKPDHNTWYLVCRQGQSPVTVAGVWTRQPATIWAMLTGEFLPWTPTHYMPLPTPPGGDLEMVVRMVGTMGYLVVDVIEAPDDWERRCTHDDYYRMTLEPLGDKLPKGDLLDD